MEEERQRDIRVPLVSWLFFLSCLTGGILLILWLLDVQGAQPWFPTLALILIGLPWIFWLLTYIYTLLKICFRRARGGGLSDSKRGNHAKPSAVSTNNMNRTSPPDSPVSSPDGNRQVQFGAVVVMDGDGAGESSVTSSKECEMPLNRSASS